MPPHLLLLGHRSTLHSISIRPIFVDHTTMMRPLKIITSSTSSRHGRSSSASFSPCLSALVLGTIFVVFVAPQARLASAADANSNVAAGGARASLRSTASSIPIIFSACAPLVERP